MELSQSSYISTFQEDGFYQALLQTFSTDLPVVLETLGNQIVEQRYQEAENLSHQMVGAAATYGYPVLAGTFQILENACAKNPVVLSELENPLETLGKICEKIVSIYSANTKDQAP